MPKEIDLAAAFQEVGEKLRFTALNPNIHQYRPHDKQSLFHSSPKRVRLYIGGNRSGKTVGGVVEDLWWLTGRHPYLQTPEPPVRGRVISVDFLNGVEKIILPMFARWTPPSDLRGGSWSTAYDKTTRTLNFSNGSFVEFMSYDQDLDKFAGTSRHFVHFDEEPPEVIYTENMARLVDTAGSMWMTMTPVEGMSWVYDTIYEPGKLGSDRIDVIEVDMTENPHLNQLEVQQFLETLSPDEREARVHGKFVQMGGLIYKHFDPTPGGLHVLAKDVDVPRHHLLVASLDHGFTNPTAWLWHSIDPDGRVTTVREHYASGLVVEQHAKIVHQVHKELGRVPDYIVGDPSIRNTDPISGTSIHQEYIKYGIPIQLANNDVRAGINRVARYLLARSDNRPLLTINPSCRNLIKEMTRYRWKTYASKKIQAEHNTFEEPHKKNDHACDSLRYMIMSRPDLTSDFQAKQDGIQEEFGQLFNLPQPIMANEGFKDPAFQPQDHSRINEYAANDSGWVVDEHMGGIW